MIKRLLLPTLVALLAGTAAYTFVAAEAEPGKPLASHIEKAQIEKPAERPRPLNRLEQWQADQQAERDAAKTPVKTPASHVSPKMSGPTLASGASAKTPAAAARPLVTLSSGVSVTEPDRIRITDAVARMAVRPLRGVDFSVKAGSEVPRELRLYSLPAEVVEIVPQYRDNRFMIVDKEILIVDPSSQKIVAILPRDAALTAAVAVTPAAPVAATPTPASVPSPAAVHASTPSNSVEPDQSNRKQAASTRAERRTARRESRDEWRRSHAEVRVGQRVPDNVVLRDLPQPYRGEVSASRPRAVVQID